ncbi:SusC/RagA family TonB-linked outer membrane protein [Flavobacterium sp.]|uniref:SusC/RagA family TonB-linked outer membrane protein n=1 Tax=Flavobacterium sp. TaxID=239 RepID=UPI003A9339DA
MKNPFWSRGMTFPILKFDLKMKLTVFLTVLSLFQLQAFTTYGQKAKVSLDMEGMPLKMVFKEIEKQTDFRFFYNLDDINTERSVSLKMDRQPLDRVLEELFKNTTVDYNIVEKQIVLTVKKSPPVKPKTKEVQQKYKMQGMVRDANGLPIPGVNVLIKNTLTGTFTDGEGAYVLQVLPDDILVFTALGFKTLEVPIEGKDSLTIVLGVDVTQLDAVTFEINTGYQKLPKERATGSFVQIDNDLLNRRVSTNILDRLDGVTSGLLFNKTVSLTNNQSTISIRGRSTIYANPEPLIVIDNFPYNGDLSSINPNTIESITILKDAAAASIWGAFSGNGVIVITTKKGKLNHAPKIEWNSNITLSEKPDLYYTPRLSSNSYIDVEQFLFEKGYFNSAINRSSHPVLSPIVDILANARDNIISPTESARLINQYREQDSRDEMSRYLYRASFNQQYSLSVSGGGENNIYYFNAGFDKNLNSLQRDDFSRISMNGSNTYNFFKNKLSLTNAVYFTKSKTDNNGLNANNVFYPYVKLKDENGNALSVPYQYRQSYIDTVGQGNLLDWSYRPLDELNLRDNTTQLTEYRINTQLRYTVIPGLDISAQYQYNTGNSEGSLMYSQDSYYARDFINKFTQYDASTGIYTRPIPLGGILDNLTKNFYSHNFRGQLDFNHQWGVDHELSALAGYEVRDINTSSANNRIYGYDELGTNALINYTTFYKYFYSSSSSRIPSNTSRRGTTNRFLSYFANFAYTIKNRYVLSGSARKDESNIFGVKSNQKGVPLWSVGGSWDISKEEFYRLDWLPYLRLRITNGYNGNVDHTLSSLITATVSSGNYYNVPYSTLTNPPNQELRWEKVNTTNFGVDFAISNFLNGNIEAYIKNGKDLIGNRLVDPTLGVSTFKGNFANMKGKGIDMTLNSKNIKGNFAWNTTLLFSWTKDKVTKYLLKPTTVSDGLSSSINPIEGNPLYSLYTFEWAGLDNEGDPLVYLDGAASKDYSAAYYSTNLSNLKYSGTANPTVFGALRNDFSWKGITLSANVTYKFGYSFRRPSLESNSLYIGRYYFSDDDYQNRWQTPGDEAVTNVPALSYPANSIRDIVYRNSSILIEKGDHIRLQDISLGYQFDKTQFPQMPFRSLNIYMYVNNIGILWRANKTGLDPDYIPSPGGNLIYPNPRTYSLGIKVGL